MSFWPKSFLLEQVVVGWTVGCWSWMERGGGRLRQWCFGREGKGRVREKGGEERKKRAKEKMKCSTENLEFIACCVFVKFFDFNSRIV